MYVLNNGLFFKTYFACHDVYWVGSRDFALQIFRFGNICEHQYSLDFTVHSRNFYGANISVHWKDFAIKDFGICKKGQTALKKCIYLFQKYLTDPNF